MITCTDCIPCFVTQSLSLLKRLNADNAVKDAAMKKVLAHIASFDFTKSPPEIASGVHRIIRDATKIPDPYFHEKKKFNDFVISLLPLIRKKLNTGHDTLSLRVKLAIAGNIIDSGTNSSLSEKDVEYAIDKAMNVQIDENAVRQLKNALSKADKILYLCDNAGEIIFDKLLIESLCTDKITCAVRGSPIINDVTISDAVDTGLADIVKVIDNGSDAPGTVLDMCSESFKKVFSEADLIISKGQGNFETLEDNREKPIFFLFQAKCPVIAEYLNREMGSYLIIGKNIKDTCNE